MANLWLTPAIAQLWRIGSKFNCRRLPACSADPPQLIAEANYLFFSLMIARLHRCCGRRTLSERDSLFVFCGHNSGEEFCYRHSVSRLPTCAPALMMGCNSARTDAEGQYEGQGYISAFLAAGCPAVVSATRLALQ